MMHTEQYWVMQLFRAFVRLYFDRIAEKLIGVL